MRHDRSRRTDPGDRTSSDQGEGARILIVDDDPEIRLALETYFQMEGYEVATAEDGVGGLAMMADEPGFDLVLLDVVLPGMNGFDVLQETQNREYAPPILMMSGRGDQENILRGFGLGAQDYIVKPFEPEDLFSRVQALVGRDADRDIPLRSYSIGEYTIDFETATVRRAGEIVHITEMEFDIIRMLIESRGCVVTKKRLLREAWHIDDDLIAYTINPDVATAKVDSCVRAIRQKLEPNPTQPRYIHTVYGLGYRFTD